MAQDTLKQIADHLEDLVSEISDLNTHTKVEFGVDTYNLIASLYEEQNRMAAALERIATALESK